MSHFKKLIGEKCYLSPVSAEDAPLYAEWLNDVEVSINLNMNTVLTLQQEKGILSGFSANGECVFAIVDPVTDMPIGTCGFQKIDAVNATAEFGIFIGDKRYWNRGFGTDATRLILDYGFNILNLKNVMLNVFSCNERAAHVYRKVGFKEIGRRREARIVGGNYYDVILMDILPEEFGSVYVKRAFEAE